MGQSILALMAVFAMEQVHPAVRASAEAAYKQFGAESEVNKAADEVTSHVPKSLRMIIGNAVLVGKSITEQRIVFTINY